MPGGVLMRIFIWVALLAILLAGRWWWENRNAADQAVAAAQFVQLPGGWLERHATAEEWAMDIAELGRAGFGKRLLWQPIVLNATSARGVLVWWHDGKSERLGYVPAQERTARGRCCPWCPGSCAGTVALYDIHGDPDLLGRISTTWIPRLALPSGLTVCDCRVRRQCL